MSEPDPHSESRQSDADGLMAGLVDDFLRRHRAGDGPSVGEYAARHPDLAGEIRQVFPALIAIEQPGLCAPMDPAPPAERVGATIGRYKLLERIGEGGFGIVYMAEQQHPVRRKVALKVIKPGLDTRQVIARFEAERQALALMEHENIAKVLDAGATSSGRPYFVMELVHGLPVTQFCDTNQLHPRARLELFVQVCRAVQHAHTKGIIHRDIKPTNVLVTLHEGVPVPKVIDFGVAKATGQQLTDKTLFTNFAQMVGTPLYMSPEQAELTGGDVDTRSDVYSLGVLLYELLTGTTPVDKERLKRAAFDEVRRIIREEEPPRPSTRLSTMGDDLATVSVRRRADPKKLPRFLRGELDWVVMKALEKDRARRYETANAFARDVERFLNDDPVLARPQGGAYRLRKLVRRNRIAFGAAGAVAAALVVGTTFSTWMFLQERAARYRAVAAEQEQERLRNRAEAAHQNETRLRHQAEAQERKAVAEAATTEQVAGFMKDMLRGAAPFVAQGRDTAVLREIVDQTAERVGRDLGAQPDVEAELRIILGQVYRDLAELPKAEAMLRRALALKRQHLGDVHPDVAVALNSLASVLLSQRKPEEAEPLCREALAIRKNALPGDHPLVAESLDSLGLVLHRQWRNAEAEPLYRQALAIHRSAFGDEHPAVALSLSNLAVLLRVEGRLDKSEALHREALALRRKVLGNEHPDVAISLNGLGNLLRDQSKLSDAEAMHREALAIRRKIYREPHPYVAQSLKHLACGLLWQGKLAEADSLLDQALAMQRMLPGRPDLSGKPAAAPPAGSPLNDGALFRREKGDVYLEWAREANRQGKPDAEESAARKAAELQPDNPLAHRQLGVALQARGLLDQSIASHRTAIHLGPNAAWSHYHLGRALFQNGQRDGAVAAYRRAIEIQPSHVLAQKELAAALSREASPAGAAAAGDRPPPVEDGRAEEDAATPATTAAAAAPAPQATAVDDVLAWGRESSAGVARAIEKIRSTDLEVAPLTPLNRLVYGEYLVVAGEPERAAGSIGRAVDEMAARGKVPPFFNKSLGWALLAGGRGEEAAAAFRRALPDAVAAPPATQPASAGQPASADPDQWTAAYFLDRITEAEYTARWARTKAAAMSWFYVGHRSEIEGRPEAAVRAYRKSAELGAAAGGQQSAHWAVYRLEVLTKETPPRAED